VTSQATRDKISRSLKTFYQKRKKGQTPRRKHDPIIQTHHISYDPEVTVTIYKGEHQILTLLGRRTRVSDGFLRALGDWSWTHRGDAVALQVTGSAQPLSSSQKEELP